MKHCAYCNALIEDGAQFCGACGQQQPTLEANPTPAPTQEMAQEPSPIPTPSPEAAPIQEPAPVPTQNSTQAPAQTTVAKKKNNTTLIIIIVAAVLVIGGAVAFFLTSNGSNSTPAGATEEGNIGTIESTSNSIGNEHHMEFLGMELNGSIEDFNKVMSKTFKKIHEGGDQESHIVLYKGYFNGKECLVDIRCSIQTETVYSARVAFGHWAYDEEEQDLRGDRTPLEDYEFDKLQKQFDNKFVNYTEILDNFYSDSDKEVAFKYETEEGYVILSRWGVKYMDKMNHETALSECGGGI